MLRLILGRAGTGKTGLILDELNELVRSRRSGGWLIVPEQYSHEAERELAERCGDTACLYAEVVSFTRLAYRVSVSVGGSARTYIDRGGRLLQLALALDRIGGTLEVYGSAARRPELMSPLLTALDELRYGRADSGALRAAASELDGPLAAKLRDLALIRETLDALEASSGADPASRLDILAEQIPGSGMFAGAEVYIDGFTDFTAQERAVIRALWNAGADVTVALSCDFADVGSEVFSSAVRTARELERRGGGRYRVTPRRRPLPPGGNGHGFSRDPSFRLDRRRLPRRGQRANVHRADRRRGVRTGRRRGSASRPGARLPLAGYRRGRARL